MKFIFIFFLSVLFISFAGDVVAAENSVTLRVKERAGVDHANEYVEFGIPIPRDWNIKQTTALRISDSGGVPLPAQFTILARWSGSATNISAPAKWVLVGFMASLNANSTATFVLDCNGPGPAPSSTLQIDQSTAGKLVVDTGTAQFELNTAGNYNLINQVTIQGHDVLQPLRSNTAIDYDPMGSSSIVSGGTPNSEPRTTSVTIERSGSLNCIVKTMGSIMNGESSPVLDYTARLYFFSGSSDVRVDFTVENNHPIIHSDGRPMNIHDQGAVNSVYIGSLKLALRLAHVSGNLRVLSEQGTDVSAPSSPVRLYQDSSGTDYWNAYVGDVGWGTSDSPLAPATPRLQAYCTRSGFTVTGDGTTKTGDQALGWMSAALSSGPGIIVVFRDFWQNFPKAIQTGTDGTLTVDLFPNGTQFRHNLRVGEEKTHTILYRFKPDTVTANEAETLAKAFNRPLFATPPASWYIGTKALGDVPKADVSKWPLYEHYVNVAFEPNPDFDPETDDPSFGNNTLQDAVEKYNFYGWQDYGDFPLDYEAFGPNQAGQMNLKYWYVYGMLVQFCRSAEPRWLDLAIPAAWHEADIDFLHIPDNGIQHWAHGAYFGHSTHDEPGCTNPNRNYNSPSVDLFFGVPDLLLAYHLTGQLRFLDTALEGLEAMENLSQFSDFTYPVFYRERACLIFPYLEGYRHTGDPRWRNNFETIIEETSDTASKGWLTSPLAYVPPAGGQQGESERISGFGFCQVLWTIGRYLDFCSEYGLTDETGATNALEVYADFIIDHLMKEISAYFRANHPGEYSDDVLSSYSGNYATLDSIWFTADYETYLEVNTWALLAADTLAYAYKYSNQQKYLNAAAKLYETGTIDQVWLADPPVYISSKDLVNACNWGMVYMKASTNECDIDINGISVSGTKEIGAPVTFTVSADNSCSSTLQYRFSVHPDYGTNGYDGLHWQSMTSTEYQTKNSATYTFDNAGKYVVVVWVKHAISDSNTGVEIIGLSVDIDPPAISDETCEIDINAITATGTRMVGSPVTFTVNADNSCSSTLQYRFSVHPDYGTNGYDGLHWQSMTSTEYQTKNSATYTFDNAGKYVVVVWAKHAISDSNAGVQLIGLSINVD